MFALLDRAQMRFELKAACYDAVRAAPTWRRRAALQALDLSPLLLGALSELLLARWDSASQRHPGRRPTAARSSRPRSRVKGR